MPNSWIFIIKKFSDNDYAFLNIYKFVGLSLPDKSWRERWQSLLILSCVTPLISRAPPDPPPSCPKGSCRGSALQMKIEGR